MSRASHSSWPLFIAAVLLLAASSSPASAALPPSVAVDWQNALQQIIRDYSIPNQLAGRYYGLLGLTQFRALDRYLKSTDLNGASTEEAVVAVASHSLLDHWFPWRYNIHDALIAKQLVNATAAQLAVAKVVAEAQAAAVSALRTNDGFATWANFKPAPANTTASIGQYQATPGQTSYLYPQLGNAKPLVVAPADITAATVAFYPNPVGSAAYQKDLEFVFQYGRAGNGTNRTAYDSGSPAFWADGAGTSSIGGHLLNVSYQVLPNTLTLYQQVKFFARFGGALADASIACWRLKYTRLFWRPVTAIRNGDGVNAPVTDWTPLLSTPAHPDYPSGHQCTSGAAYAVIKNANGGKDAIDVAIGSEGAPQLGLRNYSNLYNLVNEVGASRAYGGVHFPKDNEDGLKVGIAIGSLVLKKI